MTDDVFAAIARAEQVLPGREATTGECPRWQAIIAVGEFVESDPLPVCDFALKWSRRRGKDLAAAIHCCLIEHLLEHHFDLVLPRMREAARAHPRVAQAFLRLEDSSFLSGQARDPVRVAQLRKLSRELYLLHGFPLDTFEP